MRFPRNFYVYAWLAAVALYVWAAFAPDYYAIHHNLKTYPLRDAMLFSLVSAVECLALLLILRPWTFRGSRWRLLIALILFVPWTALCALSLMHMSPFYSAHALWLLLVVIGLVIAMFTVRRGAA
jgi:hypothetical protein